MSQLTQVILIICITVSLPAVETSPIKVLAVYDGDTITVAGSLGGVEIPLKVRLLYLDTQEVKANKHGPAAPEAILARDHLRGLLLAEGVQVTLWAPGEKPETDQYGRLLAVVRLPDGSSVQERMIRAGWSVLWEKYGAADPLWRESLQAAEDAARSEKAGAWKTDPKYMQDKANETTAPQE